MTDIAIRNAICSVPAKRSDYIWHFHKLTYLSLYFPPMEVEKETRYPNSLLYGFIVITAILFVAMVFFAYISDAGLTKDILPVKGAENFNRNTHYLNMINIIGFFIMLIYSNIYYWKKRQGGLLFIVTFILSTLFTNLYYTYLSEVFFHYKKVNGLWEGGFSLAPFFGFIITACILALVATNYVVLKKLIKEKRKQV